MKQFFKDIFEFTAALWNFIATIPACIPLLFKFMAILFKAAFELTAGVYIAVGSFLLYCAFILSPFIAIIFLLKWLI